MMMMMMIMMMMVMMMTIMMINDDDDDYKLERDGELKAYLICKHRSIAFRVSLEFAGIECTASFWH